MSTPTIAFHYSPGESNSEASLLANNLTQWGGRFKKFPHLVFEIRDKYSRNNFVRFPSDYQIIDLRMPDEVDNFPFAAKVFAAAEAEARAESMQASELVWLDPDTLFIQEPVELILKPGEKIAITPVHLQNISSLAEEPIDEFWKTVYGHCQLAEDQIFDSTSIVDQKKLRAHFNAGLIAVIPQAGILRRWRDNFESLYRNPCMEILYQNDIRNKVFAHQAILSATILQTCTRAEVKLLSPVYNFPLHLLNKIQSQSQPTSLEQFVTVRYDDFKIPGWSSVLPASEPLRSWLADAVLKASKE